MRGRRLLGRDIGLVFGQQAVLDQAAGESAAVWFDARGAFTSTRCSRRPPTFARRSSSAPPRRRAAWTSWKASAGAAWCDGQTGYPIVPVAHNAGRYWPRHSFIKHPGTVTVVIGEPIEPAGRTPEELNAEVKAWIEARMAELDAQPSPAPA